MQPEVDGVAMMQEILPKSEFCRLEELAQVQNILWLAGNVNTAIRPLHRHIVLGRNIIVCEDISLHLVTRGGKMILIKPLPKSLTALANAHATQPLTDISRLIPDENQRNLIRGFIWTYISMIKSVTDFRIAVDNHLLPEDFTRNGSMEAAFDNWRITAKSLERIAGNGHRFGNRFDRGELRLERLNLIMLFRLGRLQGYQRLDTTYGAYFEPFLATVSIVVFAFLALTLSAFQVALAYENAADWLKVTGYWCSIVTMCLILAVVVFLTLWFLFAFCDNVFHTVRSNH